MNGDSPDYRQQHVDLEKIQAHTDEFNDGLLGDGIGVDLGGGGV